MYECNTDSIIGFFTFLNLAGKGLIAESKSMPWMREGSSKSIYSISDGLMMVNEPREVVCCS